MGTTKRLDIGQEAKQERLEAFCREYVIDFNGARAAIAAGYSSKGAAVVGSKLLTIINIQKRIAQLVEKKFERIDLRADKVLMDIKNLAESDLTELLNPDGTLRPTSEWPKALALAVSSIEVVETFEWNGHDKVWTGYVKKIKLWDKTKALEMLGKNLKLFNETYQGNITQVNVNVTEQQLAVALKKFSDDY